MWFKGLSFLSYTALLVAPTNAAVRGRGKLHSVSAFVLVPECANTMQQVG
jgi:hypothetical protein